MKKREEEKEFRNINQQKKIKRLDPIPIKYFNSPLHLSILSSNPSKSGGNFLPY